jgi:threonine aldolase
LPEPIILGSLARLVVHVQTSEAAVDDLLALIKVMAEEKIKEGWVKPEKQLNGDAKLNGDIYGRRQ